jgi:hypothetical protein
VSAVDQPAHHRGRRARLLLQRYLVVFGPLHSLERAHPDRPPFEALVLDFFAGRIPGPEAVQGVHRITDQLATEASTSAPGAAAPDADNDAWSRLDRLCARLGLAPIARDVLLLLVAPCLDAGTRWLVHALFGEGPWPAERLRRILAPLTGPDPLIWAATGSRSILVRAGLVQGDDAGLRPATALLDHLAVDDAAVPGARLPSVDDDVRDAALAPSLSESVARVAAALEASAAVVVRADRGDGLSCVAAWIAQRRGLDRIELTADELTAQRPGALAVATAVRRRALVVHGVPAAGDRASLAALRELGVPILVRAGRDATPAAVAATCDALATPLVELPPAGAVVRQRWWRSALGGAASADLVAELALEPLEPGDIASAVAAAALADPEDQAAALRRACRALAAGPLDDLLDRVTPHGQVRAASAAMAAAALREPLDAAAAGLVFIDGDPAPLGTVATLIARELGQRVYELSTARALQQAEPVPRWVARVLAAASQAAAALTIPDVAGLVSSAGGDPGVLGMLLRGHPGVVFVSARERSFFAGAEP